MKLFLIVSVLLIHAFSETDCLKCYVCSTLNSLDDDCGQPNVTTCGPDMSQKYCGKAVYGQMDFDPLRYCDGNCTEKGCVPKEYQQFCESIIFNLSQVSLNGTGYCCEGDLCNSSNKIYKKNTLFYATILACTLNCVKNFLI